MQLEGADGALTVRAQGPLVGPALGAASPRQGDGQQLEAGAALSGTPSASLAAATQAGARATQPAASPGGSLQQTEDWLWDQLQQALSPVAARPPPLQLEAPGSAAASSPSLRLPGDRGSEGRQHQDSEISAVSAASSEAPLRPEQSEQQQQQAVRAGAQPAASQGSCGEGGVASLSHHWDLPSPGPGNS